MFPDHDKKMQQSFHPRDAQKTEQDATWRWAERKRRAWWDNYENEYRWNYHSLFPEEIQNILSGIIWKMDHWHRDVCFLMNMFVYKKYQMSSHEYWEVGRGGTILTTTCCAISLIVTSSLPHIISCSSFITFSSLFLLSFSSPLTSLLLTPSPSQSSI